MVIGSVVVTNQWRRYTIGFESKLAMNGIGRFALAMDRAPGVVLVRNCSLRRSEQGGLAAGEALPSISLLGETELATHARANDYLSFLAIPIEPTWGPCGPQYARRCPDGWSLLPAPRWILAACSTSIPMPKWRPERSSSGAVPGCC